MSSKSNNHGPRYLQLANDLRSELERSAYPVGSYLPTERSICEKHEVTRITVRGAMNILEKEGLIKREAGKGTKVVRIPGKAYEIELLFLKWLSPFSDPLLNDLCTGIADSVSNIESRLGLNYISEKNSIEKNVNNLLGQQSDGIIVVGSHEWYKDIMPIIGKNIPAVLIGEKIEDENSCMLYPDFDGAIQRVFEYLNSIGKNRIVFLTDAFEPECKRDKENEVAFNKHVITQNMKVVHVWRCHEMNAARNDTDNFHIDDRLLEFISPGDTIIGAGATLTQEAAKFLRRHGYEIPKDFGLISLQDSLRLEQEEIPITAVSIYNKIAGNRAVHLLKERIEAPGCARKVEAAPLQLNIRSSCK